MLKKVRKTLGRMVAPSLEEANGQQVRIPRPKGNGKFQSNSRPMSAFKGAGCQRSLRGWCANMRI